MPTTYAAFDPPQFGINLQMSPVHTYQERLLTIPASQRRNVVAAMVDAMMRGEGVLNLDRFCNPTAPPPAVLQPDYAEASRLAQALTDTPKRNIQR